MEMYQTQTFSTGDCRQASGMFQIPGVSSPNSVDIMYKYLYLRAYPFTRVSIYKVLVTLYTLTAPLPCPTGNAATEFTL